MKKQGIRHKMYCLNGTAVISVLPDRCMIASAWFQPSQALIEGHTGRMVDLPVKRVIDLHRFCSHAGRGDGRGGDPTVCQTTTTLSGPETISIVSF